MRIILASASPRRKALLELLNLKFDIVPADIEENNGYSPENRDIIVELARRKALSVIKEVTEPCIVLGADTVVIKDGILPKPRDEKDAFRMLKKLSGQWHEVVTGFCVVSVPSMECRAGYETTRVKMRMIEDEEIYSYIKTGEPMDKAGAYAIQGLGAVFVERIEGCYFNVVGLPLTRLAQILKGFGVSII